MKSYVAYRIQACFKIFAVDKISMKKFFIEVPHFRFMKFKLIP